MNTPLDPTMGDAALRTSELNIQQQRMDSMRRAINNGTPKDKTAKLREACEGFESIFIQRMWEQMQATVPKDGYLHSKDEKMWQGMYDQELSKKMAGSGGVGLADMMMQQLGKNLEDAGRKTLDTSLNRREPMPIAPAPLLMESAPAALAKVEAPAADIYSGDAPSVAEAPEAQAPPAVVPGEFDVLVNQLTTEMQQPEVTVTRIVTNTTTLNAPMPVRSGRGMRNPRVSQARQNAAAEAVAGVQAAQNAASASPAGQSSSPLMPGQAHNTQIGHATPARPANAHVAGSNAATKTQASSLIPPVVTPSGTSPQASQGATPSSTLAGGESAAQIRARQDAMVRDTLIRQAMMGVQSGATPPKLGS